MPPIPYADLNPPICTLNVKDSFAKLSDKEQLYAHHWHVAGWQAGKVIADQLSSDSRAIIDLLISILAVPNPDYDAKSTSASLRILGSLDELFNKAGLDQGDQLRFLEYAAQVFGNLSNFKSFGHTKFIPRIDRAKFECLVAVAPAVEEAGRLWAQVADAIYSTMPVASLSIGKPSEGNISGYYLPAATDISDAEASYVQTVLEANHIDPINTRARKLATSFEVLVASVDQGKTELTKGVESDKPVYVIKGDFKDEMAKVCDSLAEAAKHAANDLQRGMIADYIRSFKTGSIQAHVEGSEKWVQDTGPVVETYIGFIETYVDPYGGRAEWESFTAIVNKTLSAKYDKLVDSAGELIKELPWGPDFEVDSFRRPDFTALEITSFTTAGIPAGINIPNYPNVRADTGFKNVSLANILAATDPNEKITFLSESDIGFYKSWQSKAFEFQVALHELLGHGSGKLFEEKLDGSLNFDNDRVINPLTGDKIKSWYKPTQTSGSVLGPCASSLEECRAEAVALYLCSNKQALELFQYTDKQQQEDVQVAMFLLMARAGVLALLFYNPVTKSHGQAHMEARIGITNTLLESGIATLTETRDEQGKLVDAIISVDRKKVLEDGRDVIGKLLVSLQVLKCTADGEGARSFYAKLTQPQAGWEGELRDLVIERKSPRKLFVQPNTVLVDGKVVLKEYDLTVKGMVESYIERTGF